MIRQEKSITYTDILKKHNGGNAVESFAKFFKVKIIIVFVYGIIFFSCIKHPYAEYIQYSPNNLPDFVHPPVMDPVPDAIKLKVPKELGNRKLALLGFVDVTAKPFYGDPTGQKDSTKAIQDAINFARDAQLVCFFPKGTYVVSNTIILRQGIHMRSNKRRIINNRMMPCVLVGSQKGKGTKDYKRPVILLKENSPGFNDSDNPKYIIEHRVYKVKNRWEVNTDVNQWGMLMNTVIANLDFKIGRGNKGAAGIFGMTREGASIQDVTIDVGNGYAGLVGSAGNGGSWANIKIIGGKVGIDMSVPSGAPCPTMVSIELVRQRETAILSRTRAALMAVGIKIIAISNGPIIKCIPGNGPFDGGMHLIDSKIIFENTSKGNIAVSCTGRGIYFENVYIENCYTVSDGDLAGNSNGWIYIKQFARGYKERKKGYELESPIYIDSKKAVTIKNFEFDKIPPDNLISKHIWGENFPHWEMKEAVNVKEAPFNASGDSYNDDTAALQKAINEHDIVFLPKGIYRIKKTIKLRPNTKLIGAAQHLSIITVRDPDGHFDTSDHPKPCVETADDKNAETVIAFCSIRTPKEVHKSFSGEYMPVYSLKWQCGEKSILRTVGLNEIFIYGYIGNKSHKRITYRYPSVVITGNGGGKWYNYHTSIWQNVHKDYRCILITNSKRPLFFYNFEPQHAKSEALSEIRSSKNVSIYACKSECSTTFMKIVNSGNIKIYGHGGIATPEKGGALYVFENSKDFLITQIADQVNLKEAQDYYKGRDTRLNIMDYYPLIEKKS